MKQIFILVLFLTGSVVFAQDKDVSNLVKVGYPVPSFSFVTEKGETQSIGDLKGKVVLINFFATWCAPCLKELPHVEDEIYGEYKSRNDFEILVFGREHTQEELTNFKIEKGYSLSFYADPQRKIYSKFASGYIPRNYVVDKEGNIIYSSVGFDDTEFNELKELLKKQLK